MGKVILDSFIHFLIVIIEIKIEIIVKSIYIFRYHNFIDEKAKKFIGKILKDRPVKKVSYSGQGVRVVTKPGKASDEMIIEAQYAISTIPLGVLQKGIVEFDPPFSTDKNDSIKRFKMGNYEKIYVQFPENFWGDKEVLFSLNTDRPPSESIMTWGLNLDIDKYFKNSKMLTFHSMGPTARRIAEQDDEITKKEVNMIMRKMFPGKAVNASNILVTNWANEEYTYGSWAAMPEKFSKTDWSLVRQNEKRLYFAGEHTSSNYGFVHSAYQSGEQTAKEIYYEINNVPIPPTTVRKFCPGNIY